MRTLSPTTILMKRLRILPAMWAKTSCPLGRRTLNMVPASTAQIVPSTSTWLSELSSLGADLLKCFLPLVCRPAPVPPCGRGRPGPPAGRDPPGPPPVLGPAAPPVCPAGRGWPGLAGPAGLLPLPAGLALPPPAGRAPGREFCPPEGRLLGLGFGLI